MSYFRNAFKNNPVAALQRKEEQERYNKLRSEMDALLATNNVKAKKLSILPKDSIAVKLLLLHYSGALEIFREFDNKKSSKFLAALLSSEGAENIRKGLSNVGGINSKFKTEKNLQTVISIFEESGLEKFQKLAEKDLLRIQKK